jgi:hypothetical protein
MPDSLTTQSSGDDLTHGEIPRDFWREIPCGHPPDPVAAFASCAGCSAGHWVCHCGWQLNVAEALPERLPEAPGPIVLCGKCGCYVAVPDAV